MASIKPLQDRVIIRRVEEKEQMRGGIIVPDTAREKPQQGQVIAAGDGRVLGSGRRIPLEVKQGDVVLFGKYAGTEVKLDDEEFLIMREDDILGVIDSGKASQSKGKGK